MLRPLKRSNQKLELDIFESLSIILKFWEILGQFWKTFDYNFDYFKNNQTYIIVFLIRI